MSNSIYTDSTYLDKNPTWHEEDSPWKAEQIINIIEKNGLRAGSICEVGCGAGGILHQLYLKLDPDAVLTGYEISPQAFEICEKKKQDRLDFELKDAAEIGDGTYDLLLAIDVFEHVEDYFGFLRTLKLKAKYKIFHIPLDVHMYSVLRGLFLAYREKVGHIHYFTKETALATLADCGYEIIDYTYTGGSIDLPSRTLLNKIARLPRKLLSYLDQDLAVRMLGGWSLLVLSK